MDIKKITGLTLALITSATLQAQTIVKGKIKGVKDTMILVNYVDANGYQKEVVPVKNGAFEWVNDLNIPSQVRISLTNSFRPTTKEIASFWSSPTKQVIKLDAKDLSKYKLTGSTFNEEVKSFEKTIKDENKVIENLTKVAEEKGGRPSAEFMQQYNEVQKVITARQLDYISKNPNTFYASYLLFNAQRNLNTQEQERYLNMLNGNAINTPYSNRVKYDIEGYKNGLAGAVAPLFAAKDINGVDFDMKNLIGKKVVIIDFWASWCVPCRQANPHLKELHNKYKDKGLEVVCVADNDSSEPTWRKAVADDKIEQFIHVLRGWVGMENFFARKDISGKYGVQSLPTKVLIGLDGKVIGKYVGEGNTEDNIDKRLTEIFGF